ncbi:alpha-2-macroglobulin-like protein 1 [Gastrophryne carolinensis]
MLADRTTKEHGLETAKKDTHKPERRLRQEESRMDPLLLLSLLTLGLATAQTNKLKYMITIPAELAYPSNETVCVHITSPDADATVTVSLKTETMMTDLSFQTYMGDGQLLCVPFSVPFPSGGVQEIATIHVTVNSGTELLSENKSVLIRPMKTGMFIQADRPIFQPGEEILIRAAEFDESMKAKDDNFTLVTLQDGQGNTINQWQNVKPNSGILELSSILSPNIPLGDYKITAEKNSRTAYTIVTIDKYVLPRMEFKLNAPSELSFLESSFTIDMCSKYTYNKPVKGNIIGKICRFGNVNQGVEDICQPISGRSNVRGCYSINFNTDTFKFKDNGYHDYLQVTVSLEEDGTGEMVDAEKIISITTLMARVTFPESRSTYKSPIPHRGMVTLTGADGAPIPDEDIEIYVDGIRTDSVYTTDENGVARYSLETINWARDFVNIRAHYLPRQPPPNTGEVLPYYEDGYLALVAYYTNGISQLKIRSEPTILICREVMNLFADFSLDAQEHTQDFVNFDYMVIANGRIHQSSRVKHYLTPNSDITTHQQLFIDCPLGFFSFPVTVTSEMSPAATIFLYASLSEGNLLADSIKIPVTSCFPNPVSLQFSVKQTLPASNVNLHISALPYSLCNIRAVDKSIGLLKAEDKLPEDTANEQLKQWDMEGYPHELEELRSCPPGTRPAFTDSSEKIDTYTYLERARIKVLTNYDIRKPLTCVALEENPMVESALHFATIMAAESAEGLPLAAEIRKDFPATWMMKSVLIGSSGQLDYSMKTPDSMTQWIVDGICGSSEGLGFSQKTDVEVLKPFFMTLIVPYSVKQGETIKLMGNVLNYRRQCIKVKATLFESEDFQVEQCVDCSYTACLCDDPSYTFIWYMTFLKRGHVNFTVTTEVLETADLCDGQQPIVPDQGRSDTVQKRLFVEAHGIPVEKTHSMLICAFDTNKVHLTLPENVVLGSQSAEITVTGDIMGKPLENLDSLVKLPTGCGEQNMILFAPGIAAIKYLDATGQLTDEILEKARSYMETGYQNLLNYKHDDGSYSAFGKSDPSGSTWLTSFITKYLFLAEKYIHVDMKHINEGLAWLKGLQQEDGCFQNMGSLVHTELQGGQDSSISLTAYVLQTFLEIGDTQYDDVIANAKTCLEKCMAPESSIYTKSLCAYTYTLAEDNEKRAQLLQQMDLVAIKKDDETYWTNEAPAENAPQPSPSAPGNAEITSYMLLAYVSERTPSKEDLATAVPLVRYLTGQQTSSGGMPTTQDTVVALQGLSMYGIHTFTPGSSPIVDITDDNGFHATVSVEEDKLTVVHKRELPNIPAIYTLEVSRAGCAFVQFPYQWHIHGFLFEVFPIQSPAKQDPLKDQTVCMFQVIERYNIEEAESDGTFLLSVGTTPVHCSPYPVPSFSISINASYNNENKESNMAIVRVKMLSCVEPVRESVNKLLSIEVVKRVESSPTEVIIYLDQVGPTQTELNFLVQQHCVVWDQKPATISLLDYYESSKKDLISQESPAQEDILGFMVSLNE